MAIQASATSFTENFDELMNNQPLIGQGGWISQRPNDQIPYVSSGTGVDTSQTMSNVVGGNAPNTVEYGAQHLLSPAFSYSASDTHVVLAVDTRHIGGNGPTAGLSFTPTIPANGAIGSNLFGINTPGSALRTYLISGDGLGHEGDNLVLGDWYRLQEVVDFSTPGGTGTFFYEDLTAGQTSFTEDATLRGVPLDLPSDGSGHYTAYLVWASADGTPGTSYIDNINFAGPSSAPAPEPTAAYGMALLLALFGTGKRVRRGSPAVA